MVKKIVENLEIEPISETIYITDVATEEEMETARNIRVTQGKHVIPVPISTFPALSTALNIFVHELYPFSGMKFDVICLSSVPFP